jgi:hypothetical protein
MDNNENKDATLEQIREILLSDSVPFWDESSDFLARLATITKLQEIQCNEPALSEECRKLTQQGLEKIKELSPQLKKWVLSEAISDNQNELYLLKFMLLNQRDIKLLQHYLYLIAYEWKVELPQSELLRPHVGDLVLMDEHHRFLVVEVKYIDNVSSGDVARKKRNQRRNKVCKQAMKYGELFKMMFPWAVVLKGVFTNESLQEELSLKFKKYCKTEERARKVRERAAATPHLCEQYCI